MTSVPRRLLGWSACVGLCLLAGRGTAQSSFTVTRPSNDVTEFNIGVVNYGSLSFDGSVRRVDKGDAWEFQTRLFVTLRPGQSPNRVDTVNLTAVQFAATNVRPDGTQGPVERIAVHSEPIRLELLAGNERTAMPDVAFQISKQAVQSARFAGIGVVGDSGLLWPISLPVALTDPLR